MLHQDLLVSMPTQTSEREVKDYVLSLFLGLQRTFFQLTLLGCGNSWQSLKKIPRCKIINIASNLSSTRPTAHKSGIGIYQTQHQIYKVINHHNQGTPNADPNKKVFNQNLVCTCDIVALRAMSFLLKLYGAAVLNCLTVLIDDKVIHFYRNTLYIHQLIKMQ